MAGFFVWKLVVVVGAGPDVVKNVIVADVACGKQVANGVGAAAELAAVGRKGCLRGGYVTIL